MKRTIRRWLRRLLRSIAAVVVLGVVLLLLLQTPAAKRVVAERLASALTAASGFQVQIGAIEGTLPFDAEIADVRVSDATGPWLTVDRIDLGWRPIDLLAGRLHVTGIAGETVTLARLPAARPEQPTDKHGIDLSLGLPQLPLPTTVDALRIERIVLAPTVLGEAAMLSLSGRARLGGAAREAAITLSIARIDGSEGAAGLKFEQSGFPAQLTLDASIDEPAGGLIARALSLPGLPPVSLRLAGDGPASAWRGRLRAVAGPTRLDGPLAVAVDDALSLDLGAHAEEAGRLAPGIAAFVPPSFEIAVRLRWQPGQRLDVAHLAITAPEATAALSGGLDLERASVQASFDVAITDAARWRPLLAPSSLRTAHLTGSVSGSLDQPSFALQASIDDLVVPHISAAHVETRVAGSATLRDRQVVTALAIADEGTSSGIVVADPQLAAVIGNAAAWSITGTVDLARGEAKVEQAKITAADAAIAAAGSIAAYGHAVTATLQADFNDIGPLARTLDQPAAGRLGLTASLSGDAVAPRLSAVVSGSFRELALDEPVLMKLLGTAPTMKGTFVATDTAVEIGALEIAGADGTLTADGTAGLDDASLDLNLIVAVAEIAPLAAPLAGVDGRLAGKLHVARARAASPLNFAGTADLTDLHVPEPAATLLGATAHASAEGALDGGTVALRSAQIEGAAMRLAADGTIGNALDLRYRLELPLLAALAPLTRTDLAGSATIAGDLAGPMTSPALAGAISAEGLRVGGVPLESVGGNVSVVDLGARPQGRLDLDLVAQAQRLSLATGYRWREDGAVALTDLRLTAPQTLLSGDIAALPAGLLQGRIRGDIGDLTVFKGFVAPPVAGTARVDMTLTPVDQAQSIEAALEVQNLSFVPADQAPVSAARLTLNAGLKDAFGAPGGHAELRVDDARSGDLTLARAALVADGGVKDMQLQLQAAGEWGRPITIDGTANLAFDEAGQRLRVDRLEGIVGTLPAKLTRPATLRRDSGGVALADLDATIGTGRLTGEGRIGGERVDARLALADAPLDLIGAFVPQLDVGGVASAELRLLGSTAAPTAHADVRVRNLRVGATKIGEALGVDSTATIDIGDGRGDITAKLDSGAELALAGRLSIPLSFTIQPFTIGVADDAPVSGQLGGQADLALLPRIMDLRGDQLGGRLGIDMAIAGTVAAPRLEGDLRVSDASYMNSRTGTTLRDVTAVLTGDNDRLVLRSLTASDGGAGRLSASGSAALGSPDKARYEGELTLQQFEFQKNDASTMASGHLAGRLDLMPPAADGGRRLAATAEADDLVVNGRSVAFLGPHMTASAEGSVGAAGMTIESAQLVGTEGRLTASGTIGADLDVAYRLELPRLAALSPLVGRDLAGSATVAGKVAGRPASPTIDGALSARALRVASLAVDAAEGTFSARDLANRPQGEVALDLVARARRLSLATAYRLKEDGALALDGLKLTTPQTAVGGDVQLSASGVLNGRLRGEVGDLALIGAFLDRKCSGAAALDLAFAPARRGQAIDGNIDIRSLSLVMDDGTPFSAQRLALDARVGDAFGRPDGTAELRVTEAAVGGFSLTQAVLNAAGNADALQIRLQAKGERGRPFDLDAAGTLAVTAAAQRLRLDRLEGSFGPLKAHLNAPASLARDAGGFALAGLDAAIGDGRLTGGGGIGPKQVDLHLSVNDLPIKALTAFTQQTDVAGKITADLRLAGTPAAPSAHAEMRVADLSVGETKITETAGIEGTARLDLQGGRGTLSAQLGGSPDVAIDGQATAPLAFRLQPFALDLAPDAPVSGKVKGRINLALLPRVVDLHGDTLAGRLDMDMTLAGTPAAPRLAGEARLADGSYASADAGAVLRDVTAVIAATDDRVRLQSLTASDGGKGRLSASGTATLRGADRPFYDGALTLEHFTILNRSDALAVASGRLQLANEAQGARLGGEVTVESAELHVPDAMPPKIVKLEVVEVNVPSGRVRPVRQKEEGIALPCALGVTVKIPGHAFLRGRGIDSEWRGKLRVGGTMAAPDIRGRLEVVRGRVDLLGQPFEIETGRVAFAGGDTIDPELDFTASGEAADLTVRVHVTGVASAPKFELGSDSNLPPEEALARLLFGKNAGSLTAAQGVQLAQAAAALSGGGPGVLDKLRRTFGLDVLRVETTTGSETGASLTAGKYVSDRVFLKVQQGTTTDSRNVGVEVRVLPRVTVEGSVGAEGDDKVGVNWRYDY